MLTDIFHIAALFLRAGLAALLVISGATKLTERSKFADTLTTLGIPLSLRWLAISIPLMEVSLSFLILSGLWPWFIDAFVLLIMTLFAAVVLYALSKHLTVNCRCFGSLSDSSFTHRGLIQNGFFIAAASFVLWQDSVRVQPVEYPLLFVLLCIAGYSLLGLVTAQASQTISTLKARS
jgi:uncharacterized membrane protein YphA (DoxX/SURF4 family)